MSKILCVDTATDVCTVSVFEDKKCLAFLDSGEERSHAVQLGVFIDRILKDLNISVTDLDAIAVSKGPGSYTGLRIGVSTVKGLSYAANIPVITVCTLHAMCYGVDKTYLRQNCLDNFIFCPMLDARRMEVYTAQYESDFTLKNKIEAKVLDGSSFSDLLEEQKIVFLGNGAEKSKEVIQHKNAFFFDDYKHTSKNMIEIALSKFKQKDFEDVAYFEPFYLKDFVATTPRKNILG